MCDWRCNEIIHFLKHWLITGAESKWKTIPGVISALFPSTRAIPKSASWNTGPWREIWTNMLFGFKSRWMMLWPCNAAKPWAMCKDAVGFIWFASWPEDLNCRKSMRALSNIRQAMSSCCWWLMSRQMFGCLWLSSKAYTSNSRLNVTLSEMSANLIATVASCL